jgi:uncharacterized protein YneF (UPF0154 family)
MDHSIDIAKLSHRLRHNYSGTHYRGLKYTSNHLKRRTIVLHETTAQPITELLDGMQGIKDGKDLDSYARRAKTLVASKVGIRALVRKATVFSPRLGQPAAIKQFVGDIVNNNDGLAAWQIRSLLIQQQGCAVSTTKIRQLLKEIASERQDPE